VLIDAPGHKELTKNMITGASQADAAVLVVDAAEGVREQTRRHAYFISLLGIKQIVVLINKMDLAGWDEKRFETLRDELRMMLSAGGTEARFFVPGSARDGDNLVNPSKRTPWYDGPALLSALDEFAAAKPLSERPLRFPVQDVYSIDGKRILVGRMEAGMVEAGSEVVLLPSGVKTRVASIEVFGEVRSSASAGDSIGLTLDTPSDADRGTVVCSTEQLPAVTRSFRAKVFWMSSEPLVRGEELLLRLATQEVAACAESIEERIDSSSLECLEKQANALCETEVGRLVVSLHRPVVAEPFHFIPGMGRFVLVRGSDVVGGGVVTDEADILSVAATESCAVSY
jgi:sulfate adenylyltransferase subunit 1 (EFTu-like GTPase family)